MEAITTSPYSTDEQRWAAMIAGDSEAIGTFVCAIKTTGIYCRPRCPARRPARRNVEFFPTPVDARAAGFRACKRCHPDRVPVV